MIENLLSKMYIEGVLVSKSCSIALNKFESYIETMGESQICLEYVTLRIDKQQANAKLYFHFLQVKENKLSESNEN